MELPEGAANVLSRLRIEVGAWQIASIAEGVRFALAIVVNSRLRDTA
jgi:hypothetical protein